MSIPHEFALGEVYMPPVLSAAFVGLIAAIVTAHLLNRFRLTRHFFYLPLVFVALVVFYTIIVGTILIPF